jgi:hypothetical protein
MDGAFKDSFGRVVQGFMRSDMSSGANAQFRKAMDVLFCDRARYDGAMNISVHLSTDEFTNGTAMELFLQARRSLPARAQQVVPLPRKLPFFEHGQTLIQSSVDSDKFRIVPIADPATVGAGPEDSRSALNVDGSQITRLGSSLLLGNEFGGATGWWKIAVVPGERSPLVPNTTLTKIRTYIARVLGRIVSRLTGEEYVGGMQGSGAVCFTPATEGGKGYVYLGVFFAGRGDPNSTWMTWPGVEDRLPARTTLDEYATALELRQACTDRACVGVNNLAFERKLIFVKIGGTRANTGMGRFVEGLQSRRGGTAADGVFVFDIVANNAKTTVFQDEAAFRDSFLVRIHEGVWRATLPDYDSNPGHCYATEVLVMSVGILLDAVFALEGNTGTGGKHFRRVVDVQHNQGKGVSSFYDA